MVFTCDSFDRFMAFTLAWHSLPLRRISRFSDRRVSAHSNAQSGRGKSKGVQLANLQVVSLYETTTVNGLLLDASVEGWTIGTGL